MQIFKKQERHADLTNNEVCLKLIKNWMVWKLFRGKIDRRLDSTIFLKSLIPLNEFHIIFHHCVLIVFLLFAF